MSPFFQVEVNTTQTSRLNSLSVVTDVIMVQTHVLMFRIWSIRAFQFRIITNDFWAVWKQKQFCSTGLRVFQCLHNRQHERNVPCSSLPSWQSRNPSHMSVSKMQKPVLGHRATVPCLQATMPASQEYVQFTSSDPSGKETSVESNCLNQINKSTACECPHSPVQSGSRSHM